MHAFNWTSLQSYPTLCDPMDHSLPAPLSVGFSKQEYWRGLLCPSPEDLPDPGIEPMSLMHPALAGKFSTTSSTWEARSLNTLVKILSALFTVGFPGGATGKEPTCQCRDHKRRRFDPSQEDPLEKEMETHSSILAWRIPWTEEPGGATGHWVTKSQTRLK